MGVVVLTVWFTLIISSRYLAKSPSGSRFPTGLINSNCAAPVVLSAKQGFCKMQGINQPAILILMVLLSTVCCLPPITATSAPAVGLSISPSINRLEHTKVN